MEQLLCAVCSLLFRQFHVSSIQLTVEYLLLLRMVSLRTSRALAQWEVLRYSSGATQGMSQLGGGVLLVYHQMEYQQWVPGHQTLLTLCAMVRYKRQKANINIVNSVVHY